MKSIRANGEQRIKKRRRFLLLVDEDPLLRWSVEAHLSKWFSIESAADAIEAETALVRRCFDAVVVSANLGSDLQQIESAARVHNPTVRVIRLVTDRAAVRSAGSAACVEKPFRLEELTKALGVETKANDN